MSGSCVSSRSRNAQNLQFVAPVRTLRLAYALSCVWPTPPTEGKGAGEPGGGNSWKLPGNDDFSELALQKGFGKADV